MSTSSAVICNDIRRYSSFFIHFGNKEILLQNHSPKIAWFHVKIFEEIHQISWSLPILGLAAFTIIFHSIIYVRLYFEKVNSKYSPKTPNLFKSFLQDIDAQSLVNYPTIFLIAAVAYTSTGIIVKTLNETEGRKFDLYPYNILIYFRSLLAFPLANILSLSLFLYKRNYIKLFVEEFKSIYFWNAQRLFLVIWKLCLFTWFAIRIGLQSLLNTKYMKMLRTPCELLLSGF